MGLYYDRNGDGVYLADSSGAGWFALLVFLAIPFFMFALFMSSLALWISKHFFLTIIIFSVINLIISIVIGVCRGKYGKYLICDAMGNFLLIHTVLVSSLLYCVPYLLEEGEFKGTFEWIIVMVCNVLAIIVVQFINNFHGSTIVGVIIDVICFVLISMLIKKGIAGSYDNLVSIYDIVNVKLFNILFGLFF